MDQILLVDDEKPTLEMLGLLLRSYGYRVLTAENAAEGLEIFRKEGPPVVLTDIKMPGMDGIELLRRIKSESPETEIIMITGHGDLELAIQSLKHDATDFITKPINVDVLEIALKRANERMSFRREIREYTENLERLVEEKTRELLEAERLVAVGQTVAGLAHAIKNISGHLRGGAFVLEKGFELKNEKYLRQGWDMVKGNVSRISNMAIDLLNYSKERKPNYQLCCPNRIMEEVVELMQPSALEHHITLQKSLDEGLPQVWLDPEGIHRCLANLLTNAIDACREAGSRNRRPEILVRSLKPEGWAVGYQIEDNGCGMDEETRNQVFRLFFSTKGSRGTGLGLMMTKKIIDEHGGVIELESEKDRGTRFYIRLPERDQPSG